MAEKRTGRPRKPRRFGTVQHLKSGKFQAKYTGLDGGRYPAPHTFTAERDARRWLDDIERLISAGEWTPDAGKPQEIVTLRVVWERYKARKNLAESTIKTEGGRLEREVFPVFGDRDIRTITRAQVGEWYDAIKARGTRTVHVNAYRPFSQVMKFAQDEGLIDTTPCTLRSVKRPRPLSMDSDWVTKEDTPAFLAAWPERYRLMAKVALIYGLRVGELIGLRRRDVDLKARMLTVAQSWNQITRTMELPKTEASVRTLPLTPELATELAAHLASRPSVNRDAPLFPRSSDSNAPFSESTFQTNVKSAMEAIGKKGSPHTLRRSMATRLGLEGYLVPEIQAFGGWEDSEMVLKYQTTAGKRTAQMAAAGLEATAQPHSDATITPISQRG